MRTLRLGSGCVVAVGVLVMLAACGDDSTATVTSDPAAGGDGGPDSRPITTGSPDAAHDAPPEATLPPGCDGSKSPKQDACVIDDAAGVFLAPSGDDGTGQGTKTAPFRSFKKAIAVAKATNKRVYACAATYDEAVVLDASTDGVSLYGGLACPGGDAGAAWGYTGTRAVLAPSAVGYAFRADTIAKPVVLEDLELDAKDAVDAGKSSIAAYVRGATNIVLRRVRLVAGNGVAGANGTAAVSNHTAMSRDGNAGTANNVGVAKVCTCVNATTSTGAIGGTSNVQNAGAGGQGAANPATAIDNALPANTGAGGSGFMLAGGVACTAGHAGENGATGSAGAGAAAFASIDATGWNPAAGAAGGAGKTGEGGGGGGGGQTFGGSGGACGGCGGGGGGGGGAGGSSIALLASDATVTLETCELVAGNGADGGTGAAGEIGQGGGSSPSGGGNACAGGDGGNGGGGGGGGGGAGGISAGIVYTGKTLPMVNGTAVPTADMLAGVTLGNPGNPGQAGSGGAAAATNGNAGKTGSDGTVGIAGVAKSVIAIP